MAVATADLESHITELCDEAFEAFCEDISSMFDADIQCQREFTGVETIAALRKRFKKLAAVHLVQATGLLEGTFQLLFDQGGLFVLSGVIVMLPDAKIRQQIKSGCVEDAENLTDAARETGNLLVGSWDRIFREGCEGHKHFVKSSTFIGKPWDKPEDISLSADEDVLVAVYEMTVDSYPSFHCAALFPKHLLSAKPPAAQAAPSEPESVPEPEPKPQDKSEPEAQEIPAAPETPVVQDKDTEPSQPQAPEQKEGLSPAAAEGASVDVSQAVNTKNPPKATEAKVPESAPVREAAPVAQKPPAPPETPAEKAIPPADLEQTIGIMSDKRAAALIDEIFEQHAVYPADTGIHDLLNLPASDVMGKDVVWCDPDDAVQDVLAAMQQHNTGYVLVGRNEVIEGLVSNSNITAAISPYLRPTFAKWRRPEDDATLGIKIKWMMTRPVRTVKPSTSLATMIESMRRYGGRCLPVVDDGGKVQGIVTVFDILLRVLEGDKSSSWHGSPPQGPPLMV